MDIGNVIKVLESLDAKELGNTLSKLMSEAKRADDMNTVALQIGSGLTGLSKTLGGFSTDLEKCVKAMKTKSSVSEADRKEARKKASKLMKTWQANRTKLLEQQIGDLEKKLASLRKQLALVKGAKPEGWFM